MTPESAHDGATPTTEQEAGDGPEGPVRRKGAPPRGPDDRDEHAILHLPPADIRIPSFRDGAVGAPSESDVTVMEHALREAGGMIHAIVVRPTPASKRGEAPYELVAGRLRLEAAVRRDQATVPCRVWRLNPRQAMAVHALEDLARKQEPQLTQAWTIRRTLKATGWSQAELCRRTSLTPGKVSELVGYADLIEERAVPALCEEFGVEPERVCEMSRAELRTLKRARAEGDGALRAALGQILTDPGGGGPEEASTSAQEAASVPLEVAGGCVRINPAKLGEVSVVRLLATVVWTIAVLTVRNVTSRIFAGVRDAK